MVFCYSSLSRLRQVFYIPLSSFFSLISKCPKFGTWSQFLCSISLWVFSSFPTQDVPHYTLSTPNLESTSIPGSVARYFESKTKELGVLIMPRLLLLGPFTGQSQIWGIGGGKGRCGIGKRNTHTRSYKHLQFKTNKTGFYFNFLRFLSPFFHSNLIYKNINKLAHFLNLQNCFRVTYLKIVPGTFSSLNTWT